MNNNKYFYPSLFHEKGKEGGYWVSFPDLPECLTQGEDIEEAYRMSVEALGLALEDRVKVGDVPDPSAVEDISVGADSYVVIIEFDPSWLNEEAQEALKEKLGV